MYFCPSSLLPATKRDPYRVPQHTNNSHPNSNDDDEMDENELWKVKYLFRGSRGYDGGESDEITAKGTKGLSNVQMQKPAPRQRYMIGN